MVDKEQERKAGDLEGKVAKKSDGIPEWVTDEIQNAEFEEPLLMRRTGYILEIYWSDRKIDVQLYEPVEDGRHIITMDVQNGVKTSDLRRGVIYEFEFKSIKAPLSRKVVEFLRTEKGIEMDCIFQFRLEGTELIDSDPGAGDG